MAWSEREQRRIELAASCRATDGIPKVGGAGEVRNGVQTMHNGVHVVEGSAGGAWSTEVIRRLRGHCEPQQEVVFHELLERLAATGVDAPVSLELGASWGWYSLWLLQRFPSARTHLVDADPARLELARRNFALNKREGTFLQATVGGEGDTLPALLDRLGLDHVDVLRCDVAGAEHDVLAGGAAVLRAGRVRFAVVSTHHHSIGGDPLLHQRTLELLRSLGAHVVAEHTVGESFAGDGLIAVSFESRDRDVSMDVPRARVGDSVYGDPLRDLARAEAELAALRAENERLAAEVASRPTGRRWGRR